MKELQKAQRQGVKGMDGYLGDGELVPSKCKSLSQWFIFPFMIHIPDV